MPLGKCSRLDEGEGAAAGRQPSNRSFATPRSLIAGLRDDEVGSYVRQKPAGPRAIAQPASAASARTSTLDVREASFFDTRAALPDPVERTVGHGSPSVEGRSNVHRLGTCIARPLDRNDYAHPALMGPERHREQHDRVRVRAWHLHDRVPASASDTGAVHTPALPLSKAPRHSL